MDLSILLEDILLFLGNYGFIIVIVFGVLHPIFDAPWSFLTLTLSFTLLGVPLGLSLLVLSNIFGITLLYIIMNRIDARSNQYLYKKKISGAVLKWLETTPLWKHVIVIGVPMVPTFFIKMAFPFTKLSFKKYFYTVLLAYLFLYSIYSLVYFGILSFLTENVPNYVGTILIALFVLILYFGKAIYQKLSGGMKDEYKTN